jgi:hypothetical protein
VHADGIAADDDGAGGAAWACRAERVPVQLFRRRAARSARAGAESVGSAALCRWSDTPTSVSSRNAVSSDTFGRLPCSNSLMSRGLTPALAASSAMDIRRLRRASRSADAMVNKGGDE